MLTEFKKTICLTAILMLAYCHGYSQPKSVGVTFAVTGFSLSYEHSLDNDSFIDVGFKAKMDEVFSGRGKYPGGSTYVLWNMIFAEKETATGNKIRFFAGPGATAGYCADFKRPPGPVFGLSGSLGMECMFDRNVQLSLSINPILGAHISVFDDHLSMKLYRSGLIYSLIPEIGIKYMF